MTYQMEQMQHQLSLENRGLQVLYQEMKAERDDLQIEIWELEDLLQELFELLTVAEADQSAVEAAHWPEITVETRPLATGSQLVTQEDSAGKKLPAELTAVDMSGTKLALVGGHDSTRRGVIHELVEHHGLLHWVELPPFEKHSIGRSNIKAKIYDCDLIVLITGYMRHKQTDSIVRLRKLGALSGDVLLVSCRGRSGVVREILAYIGQKNC
ncbi:MAG: hypothetical protein KME20_03710 [Kaiparowitsia implicata GSE-PSE-MK54-09C]|nr:hypothetical protein [Kaiparowitsia implicata GSE-PSE-MK54-09C]